MVVLHADDDLDDREWFKEALNKINPSISLIGASDGEEVLNFLQADIYPDLIFLDINMPVMNGLICLEMIRLNSKWKHLPVIIFTTAINEEYVKKCESLDAQFISKPYTFNEMCAIISLALKQF